MKKFKISQLENFSGIKAHTIRIWEQRFEIFKPSRTSGNMRYYNLEEVKHLLDIALLTRFGYKISQLTTLDCAALNELIDELTTEEALSQKAINDLIVLMFSNEIEELEDVLDACVHVLGIKATVQNVILPFMERVCLLSYNESSPQVHFAITALRKKLMVALDKASPATLHQKTALLFLPEREHYDLMLLYAAYELKCKGIRLFYLGTNISQSNLQLVAELKKPDFLVTYVPYKRKFEHDAFVHYLDARLPASKFFVIGCGEAPVINMYKNVEFLHFNQLRTQLFISQELLVTDLV